MSPGEAIEAGASYLVVGRPIIGAPDPRAAAELIAEEIGRNGDTELFLGPSRLRVPFSFAYLAVKMNLPRRFRCQHASFSSPQAGASSPLLTIVTRSAVNPMLTR